MRRRWVRIAVVVVTLATLGFIGNQVRLSELALDNEQAVERVFTDLSWALTITLADLGAAQQAYVAAGQDRLYWTAKVNSHLDTLRSSLDNLQRLATNSTSIEALESASSAVADLERMDGRAREHADLEQPLLASDLIFSDGLELAGRAATHVQLARASERTSRYEAIRVVRSSQVTMAATAAGVSLLAMLLLVPTKHEESSAPSASINEEEPTGVPKEQVDLLVENRQLPDDLDATEAASPTTTATDPVPTPASASPGPVPDLRIAADLCTDLCKLGDASELPELLARAAALLNATGLIIWVRDSSGHALRAAIGHGYPEGTLTRLGPIHEDGKSATAAAYRSGRMQVVERDGTTSGALAAPLTAADSCVGVLSAEVREGWESSEGVQATAAIMAAQLSTLLSVDPLMETAAPSTEAHG